MKLLYQIFISQFIRAGLVSAGVIGAGLVVIFGILGFLQNCVDMSFHGLVLVALNTNKLKDFNIQPSFRTILENKTIGGILLSNVILNLYKENKLGLPLFLTPKGIKASHDLIDMLNSLPTNNNSKFKGDNLLLDYLSKKTKTVVKILLLEMLSN